MKVIPVLFGAICLGLAFGLDFHQLHNDYWDVHFIASHLAWADRQTWFNPQYPIGYVLLLKSLLGFSSPTAPAILANILFASGTVWLASRLYSRLLSPAYTVFALLALCLFPEFLRYATVGGGDPGSVFFFMAGAVLILSALYEEPAPGRHWGRFFCAGLLFGIGALFRYHALVTAVLLGLALLAVYPRHWKSGLLVAAGTALAYSPQWAVNLLSGHGLMETQFGPMNVYDLMHGLNWHRITGIRLPGSVGQIIAEDPGLFFRKYLAALWSFKHAYLPIIFAAVFERDPRARRVAMAIALWAAAYFVLFSATTSGRQSLLAVPLTFLGLGLSARIVWRRLATRPSLPSLPWGLRYAVALLLGALLLGMHLYRDFGLVAARARSRDATMAVESFVKGAGVTRANQVFTSDFNLYFRTVPGPLPYFNGGAPRLGTWLYNETYPEFPVDSTEAFARACRARGVRFVVLGTESRHLSAPLAAVYAGTAAPVGMVFETDAGDYKIYRVL
jgi:hypothetical protein